MFLSLKETNKQKKPNNFYHLKNKQTCFVSCNDSCVPRKKWQRKEHTIIIIIIISIIIIIIINIIIIIISTEHAACEAQFR